MVPNIDPKNSNLLFFPNLYVTGSCSSNKTVVGWYGFQWDLGDFEFQDGFNHLWKTWNQENINTRAEVFPPDRQFKGWNEIKLKGRDIGFMWFFGKHLIKFGIVPSLFPKKKQLWSGVSNVGQYLNPCFLPLNKHHEMFDLGDYPIAIHPSKTMSCCLWRENWSSSHWPCTK